MFWIPRPLAVRFIFLGVMVVPSMAWGQGVVYENSFDDDAVGLYTPQTLAADWNDPPYENGLAQGRGRIVAGAEAYDAGRSLRLLYPEGSVGPSDSTGGGAQWNFNLDQSYDELYLSYRVKFGESFDFVRGGKLPGLAGGTANSGGNPPDGTDGWSARMMWRTNGSGGSPATGDTANLVQYVYHPDQPGTFGEDFRYDDGPDSQWQAFEDDRWYQLQHRVVMNTPGQNDGLIQGWVDGELVMEAQGLRFRDTADFPIDQVFFSTFFGGGDPSWAPTKDEFVYFDDFVVSTESIIPEPAAAVMLVASLAGLASRRAHRRP